MLMLSRLIGQSIHIGDDIIITVVGKFRNQIKIGIVAPKSIPVYRAEIYAEIQADKLKGEKE